jgi:hypothetical protein
LAPTLPRDAVILVNLSGRGDKDMETVAHARRAARDGGAGTSAGSAERDGHASTPERGGRA